MNAALRGAGFSPLHRGCKPNRKQFRKIGQPHVELKEHKVTGPPLKILAIQFKYYGDTALMTPALRAIREHFRDCALHALVPEEVAPLLNHLPWLTRVWPMPRRRGRARFNQTWPVIRALRDERFDRSVDFGGNDRGAILSLLCGARQRLGPIHPGGFIGRRFCYTQRVSPAPLDQHETVRLLHILSAWGITPPRSLAIEIRTDPALDAFAAQLRRVDREVEAVPRHKQRVELQP